MMRPRRRHGVLEGIPLKKKYGQHFLRDQSVINVMFEHVTLDEQTNVFEIGCGDGFLTRSILQRPIARLWVFEIDPEWAEYVKTHYPDTRLEVFQENFLDVDLSRLEHYGQWTLLANLPYQITFAVLKKVQRHRAMLREGVIMVQEEVAQKIVALPGHSTSQSLYFGYYFTWKLLRKVPPGAFYPPPQVYSRLLYFSPKTEIEPIADQEAFWRFVKICFQQRRRTLKNNLAQSHYSLAALPEHFARARAQELSLNDFLNVWQLLRS